MYILDSKHWEYLALLSNLCLSVSCLSVSSLLPPSLPLCLYLPHYLFPPKFPQTIIILFKLLLYRFVVFFFKKVLKGLSIRKVGGYHHFRSCSFNSDELWSSGLKKLLFVPTHTASTAVALITIQGGRGQETHCEGQLVQRELLCPSLSHPTQKAPLQLQK